MMDNTQTAQDDSSKVRKFGNILIRSFSLKKLVKNIAPITIVIIALMLALRNYEPGTFLTGWDTLHPEFNFKIYWTRIIDGLWQEHQGLGAVATQAHASEIPRIILIQLFDIFMSVDQIRYAYAFLMLILGPLGVFFFLKKVALRSLSPASRELGSFAGALLYLLNLGTMQHFYVPLEMFLTHYGFLGWVFLYAARFFESGKRNDLGLFLFFSLLIAPQAHTPTLFYAYILIFISFFGILVLFDTAKYFWYKILVKRYEESSEENIKTLANLTYLKILPIKIQVPVSLTRLVSLVLYTLLINSFWLLPNGYFIVNHSDQIKQSKIHHLFSEEAFLQNKEYGKIQDVAVLRNFLFNWGEHVGNGEFGNLMDEWILHLNRPHVETLGYAFFGVVIAGIVISAVAKKRYAISAFTTVLLGMFFLFNVNPPLGFIYSLLQDAFPIFKEAFRFPFTKFSIALMFSYAIFFGFFFGYVYMGFEKIVKLRALRVLTRSLLYGLVLFSLVYYMEPAFSGHLISPSMRVKIPERYFNLFDYLYQQKEYGRVADLPIHSFWGWVYHSWNPSNETGYQGAGFLWFGIKQPLLDREFDRWNLLNENYYREMSKAVYSEDLDLFEKTLEKYKVRWVLVDNSVISPGSDRKVLFLPEIKELLTNSSKIVLDKDFGNGLYLYKYNPDVQFSLTQKLDKFAYSDDSTFKEYSDPVYDLYGDYINYGNKNFPYIGITDFTESLDPAYISSDEQNTYFTNRLTFTRVNVDKIDDLVQFNVSAKLVDGGINIKLEDVPGFLKNSEYEFFIPLEEYSEDMMIMLGQTEQFTPGFLTPEYKEIGFVSINPSVELEVSVLKPVGLEMNEVTYKDVLERCSGSGYQSTYKIEYLSDGFRIYARDLSSCVTLKLTDLISFDTVNNGLVQIGYDLENLGANPRVCMLDSVSGLCVNSPIQDSKTFSKLDTANPDKYFLRFFAENILGREETGVGYKNIVVKTFEPVYQGIQDLSAVSKVESEYLGKMVFKKDLNYSGNATSLDLDPKVCSTGFRTFTKSDVKVEEDYVRYESRGESLCDSFQLPFSQHDTGYILEMRARNLEGIPLRVCLTNEYSKRCDLQVSLGENRDFTTHYFLVPPMGKGSGYTINISNIVFGEGVSVNDLQYISLTPFPYDFLRSLHKNVQMSDTQKLLVYNQAYEKGWTAFCGLLPCDAVHVKVNNWANGWLFDRDFDAGSVTVFFWPQILQYIGFILMGISYISVKRFKED